jgi:hypothetical protein
MHHLLTRKELLKECKVKKKDFYKLSFLSIKKEKEKRIAMWKKEKKYKLCLFMAKQKRKQQ